MIEAAKAQSEWKTWRFDQIAINVNERIDNPAEANVDHYVGLEHLDPNSLKIRRWGKPDDVEATKLCFKKGDIIFGRRRAYQRKLAVADFDGICSAHAMVLRPRAEVVHPEFLPFFLQSEVFMKRALEISVGSLSPTINWKTLAIQQFSIPTLETQEKIANLLTCISGSIDAYVFAASQATKLRKSLSQHLFSRGLYGAPGKFVESHYGVIPKNWKTKPLGEVFDILDNKRIPLKDSERKKRLGPYPYYGASGPIDYVDDFLFDEPLLLLSEDGMNLLMRNSPIVYKVEEKCWVNNHAHVLRPKEGLNINFYYEYLGAISYQPFVTGTYQKKITKADCERIPLPIPPVDEQEAIADMFNELTAQEKKMSRQIKVSSSLLEIVRENVLEWGQC